MLTCCNICFQIDPSLRKRDKTPSVDSDSDDYDLDSDLQDVRNSQDLGDHNSQTQTTGMERKSASLKRTHCLKNNTDSDMNVKIQGLLEKISKSSSKISKARTLSDDCGVNNKEDGGDRDITEDCDESLSHDEKLSIHPIKQASDKEISDSDNEDVDSEDEDSKSEYRCEMLKQATENFYKNQSTVSYLRKYIYGDSEYLVLHSHFSMSFPFSWRT